MGEIKSESLETRLERPNWKQWLPVYGVYSMIKDGLNNGPFVGDSKTSPKVDWGYGIYQSISIITLTLGVCYFVYYG